jgi:hypothetical protein
MGIQFLADELARWDEGTGDSLALGFFSDERPLRGAAGLADWRLCGRISRLIRQRRLSGKRGETLMLPTGKRLPFQRVILFGLGDSSRFDEEVYRQHVRWMRDVIARAGSTRYAIQVPGRAAGFIGARRALELWLEETEKAQREEDVIVIDTAHAQKEMAEILRFRGRKSTKA